LVWEQLREVKGAVLRPTTWQMTREVRSGTLVYIASREGGGAAMRAGLTVNVFRDTVKRFGAPPSKLAEASRRRMQRLRPDAEGSESTVGKIAVQNIEVVDTTGVEAQRIRCLWVSNDATGTLYAMVFECPDEEWARMKPLADEILRAMVIDDEM
jgi:hypothetical protein